MAGEFFIRKHWGFHHIFRLPTCSAMQYPYLFSFCVPSTYGWFLLIAIGARLEETSPILVLVALPTVVLLCREMLQPPDRRKTLVLNCLCFLCGFVLQFLMVGVISSSMLKHVGIDFRFVGLCLIHGSGD
ncbi:hypothetical protein P3L10_033896 [Capsicum annuum]